MERCANAWEKGKTRILGKREAEAEIQAGVGLGNLGGGGCGRHPNPATTQLGSPRDWQKLAGGSGGGGEGRVSKTSTRTNV